MNLLDLYDNREKKKREAAAAEKQASKALKAAEKSGAPNKSGQGKPESESGAMGTKGDTAVVKKQAVNALKDSEEGGAPEGTGKGKPTSKPRSSGTTGEPQGEVKAGKKANAKSETKSKAKAKAKAPRVIKDGETINTILVDGKLVLLGCPKCRGNHTGCAQCWRPEYTGGRYQQ